MDLKRLIEKEKRMKLELKVLGSKIKLYEYLLKLDFNEKYIQYWISDSEEGGTDIFRKIKASGIKTDEGVKIKKMLKAIASASKIISKLSYQR